MKKLFNVIPPKMPNFVRFEKEVERRQSGFKADGGFDIANFTEDEAIEFSELMRKTFIQHWMTRKEIR